MHDKLAAAKINVTAVDAVCAGAGQYGAILWVAPRDVGGPPGSSPPRDEHSSAEQAGDFRRRCIEIASPRGGLA